MFIFYTLPDARVLNSFKELCIMRAAAKNSFPRVLNPHGGAYILSPTDCFIVSQLFSVAWHIRRLKLGLKPAQPYVRFSIILLSQQVYHVSSRIMRCVCVCVYIYIYIYIHTHTHTHEVHTISFQTFFVWALLLIVHTWNSSPLPSNLLRLQCTCCTVPTTSRRPHGSSLVWVCQWPSSQPLSSPQLSYNDSLWV